VPAVKERTPRLMSSMFGLFAGLSYRFSGRVLKVFAQPPGVVPRLHKYETTAARARAINAMITAALAWPL
jgi:hypothetical protein